MSELRYWISKSEFIQAFKERYKEEFPSLGLDDRAYFIAGFLEAGGVFERVIQNKPNSDQNPERSEECAHHWWRGNKEFGKRICARCGKYEGESVDSSTEADQIKELKAKIEELEFWKEQNDLVHAQTRANYLKLYNENSSLKEEAERLKGRIKELEEELLYEKVFGKDNF